MHKCCLHKKITWIFRDFWTSCWADSAWLRWMCVLRFPFWVNAYWQNGHMNGLSPVCFFMCIWRAFFWLKDFLHTRQAKGRSPVWTLRCLTSWLGLLNFFSQTLQTFSLLCEPPCPPASSTSATRSVETSSFTSTPCPVSRWEIRSFSVRKTRSHQGQIYTWNQGVSWRRQLTDFQYYENHVFFWNNIVFWNSQ